MEYIDINLMRTPQTYFNNELIRFPYKKAEALFYYIVVEKVATRDQAAAMFWHDCNSEMAKQNIRQTLYVLKKIFNDAVIESLPNHQIGISNAYIIRCDLDDFYKNREMGLYKGEIFQGFSIPNAALFEEWLSKKRKSVKSFFLSNQLDYMQAIPADKLGVLENYFNRYVSEDAFDERAYRIMLKGYLQNGLYTKGILLYQKLAALLIEETGVAPANETAAIHHQLVNGLAVNGAEEIKPEPAAMQSSEPTPDYKKLAYNAQLKKLYNIYTEFLAGKGKAVLISGESGAGKSFLVSEFLNTDIPPNTLVLKITCYKKNKELLLRPWNDIMLRLHKYISEEKIDIPRSLIEAADRLVPVFGVAFGMPESAKDKNYDYLASKNSILQILRLVIRHTRLVILFENIHAMDALSLDILTSLVHTARQDIFILCTCLAVVDRDTETFISATRHNRQLIRIHLSPLSFDETKKLVRSEQISFKLSDEQIREICTRSQGNLFFIQEFLSNLENGRPLDCFSRRAQDMLNDQLSGLNEPTRQLLDVISVFAEYVVLDELCYMQDESSAEISRKLDQLKGRSLINEKIIEDRVCFVFSHPRMRDFIYGKVPPARKRELHELAGMACENVSSFNLESEYHLMIRHYSLGGNTAKALQYRIQKLSDDMFPEYESFITFTKEAESSLPPEAYLQSLLDELIIIREQQPDALAYDRLEAIIFLAQSRCCLLSGDLDAGVAAFTTLMDRPYIWSDPQFLFRAYLQLMEYIVRNTGSSIYTHMETEYARIKGSVEPFEKAAFKHLQALPAILGGDRGKARYLLDTVAKHIRQYQP